MLILKLCPEPLWEAECAWWTLTAHPGPSPHAAGSPRPRHRRADTQHSRMKRWIPVTTAKNRTPWAAGRASGARRTPAASLTALGWVLGGPGPPEADERRAGAARSLLRSSAPLRREARPGGSGTRGKKGGKAEGGKLPPHGPKAWGTPAGCGPLWTLLEGDSQILAPCFTRTKKKKKKK